MTTYHNVDPTGTLLPQVGIEIDFTNDPTNPTRAWTDVTADVRSISYSLSGRNDILQQTAPGTLTMVLSNQSGNYDPANTAGAHYPGVKRMRWIRVRGKWSGVEYNRWMGLITSWVVEWPGSGKDSIVTVTASDALKVLNLLDLGGQDFPAQRTDQRVGAVCTLAGLTSTLDTGASSVVDSGTISTGTNGLAHLQEVENTENGRLFAAADATITFQSRHYRLLNSLTAAGTIGDAAGEIPYRDATFTSDDANIWNEIVVTPSGGTPVTAGGTASQTRYYERTLTRDLLTSNQDEAADAADYLLAFFQDPSPKLPAITLLGASATSSWPTILASQNSQRFTFRRRPTYGGTIQTDGYIEQISEAIIPGSSWETTLQLLPAADQAAWVAGDSVYGVAGVTTIASY